MQDIFLSNGADKKKLSLPEWLRDQIKGKLSPEKPFENITISYESEEITLDISKADKPLDVLASDWTEPRGIPFSRFLREEQQNLATFMEDTFQELGSSHRYRKHGYHSRALPRVGFNVANRSLSGTESLNPSATLVDQPQMPPDGSNGIIVRSVVVSGPP